MAKSAQQFLVALEDGLHVVLGEREGVQVATKDPRVDHLRVIAVRDVGDLPHAFVHPHESAPEKKETGGEKGQ